MIDEEMICNMSKRKLREYLLAHPDEAYEIYSMVDLRSKGFDIIIDMDHKNFSEDYWEQLDDGYDPEAYFDDD